jgi:hypothetical protein
LEDVVFAPDAAPIMWASAVVTWGDETYAESGL